MRKQAKLAFDMLEKEMECISTDMMQHYKGGTGNDYYYGSGDYGSGDMGSGWHPLTDGQLQFIKTAENYEDHVEYKGHDSSGNLIYDVGWGHRLTPDEIAQYKAGTFDTSSAHLEQLFQHDVANAEAIVNADLTNPNINQNMYGAMVDLVFNAGSKDFNHSNMLSDVNNGDFIDAGLEFEHWNAQESAGIDTRRANEENMFYTPISLPDSTWAYTPRLHTGTWENSHPSSGN